MQIDIDEDSGFCFGVTSAIRRAEEELAKGQLFCLGDIVHNSEEVSRLSQLGLETIDYDDLRTMHNVHVLFRAHGEPPSTYHIAEQNNICVTDATCPVVLALQKKIRSQYEKIRGTEAQIVIYGQVGHAEVIGLQGQTNNTAIVVESEADLDKIDFSRDIYIFSQTTKSVEGFHRIVAAIEEKASNQPTIRQSFDTICRNVANRVENMRRFAAAHDIVFFVGGKKSSNAKVLYNHCLSANPNTIFISSLDEITSELLSSLYGRLSPSSSKGEGCCVSGGIGAIGITGATSTPHWLMEQVKERLMSVEC